MGGMGGGGGGGGFGGAPGGSSGVSFEELDSDSDSEPPPLYQPSQPQQHSSVDDVD